VFGEDDVPLEEAIDSLFKQLQQSFNYTHSSVRELHMSSDRGDEFKEIAEVGFTIQNYVRETADLFAELQDVVKQVVGTPKTQEDKLWYAQEKLKIKQQILKSKQEMKAEKQKAKEEAKQAKEAAKSN